MKQFFKMFIASLLAIAFFIGIFLLLMFISVVFSSKNDGVKIARNSILKIETQDQISSYAQSQINFGSNLSTDQSMGFYDVLKAIDKAKNDANISAIFIRIKDINIPASFENSIRNRLLEFKKTGKKIYAYGENVEQSAYFLASIADSFFVNKEGMVMLKGYSANITFYKGLLDKLGVEPEITYCGNFKSATEPFRLEKMSDYNKLQMTQLISDYYNLLISKVSSTRKIDTNQLSMIINQAKALNPDSAKAYHIIDDVRYENEMWNMIAQKMGWSIDDDYEDFIVDLKDYIVKINEPNYGNLALLHLDGEIASSTIDKAKGQITAKKYADEISKIRKDNSIKAVVLHVNSPGGDVVTSEILWNEINELKKNKPVVVYMSNVAASGGYYISTPADKIMATPYTITGSIGVFGMHFNAQKLMNDKLGITTDQVKIGTYSDYGNIDRQMTSQEKELTQNIINKIYENFMLKVSKGRNIPLDKVRELAQGRVYTGYRALQLGLVDSIGDISNAIYWAANMAKIDKINVVQYPKTQLNPFEQILSAVLKNEDISMKNEIEIPKQWNVVQNEIYYLLKINNRTQMRMPFDFNIK